MPFDTALSGLQAAASELRIIGNNVANAGTDGFKQSKGEFSDVYASSALGTTSTAIGGGVRLAAVKQQFTQGTINFTDNNLDLAINGEGFFQVDSAGTTLYSRAGGFSLDRNGNVVNAAAQKLQGFGADSSGTITGVVGDIVISSSNLSPQASATVTPTINLNSAAIEPTATWVGTSTFGGTAPATTTYNETTSLTVFDSLGNSHVMNMYFDKTDTANTWDTRFQIDGVDVYTTDSKANTALTTGGSLTTAGSVPTWTSTELTINGVGVTAGVSGNDTLSTSDNAASAIALAAAINGESISGVSATANATVLNLGTFTTGTLAGDDFKINNHTIAATSQATLLTAIAAVTSIVASAAADSSGNIIVTAKDGRNLEVEADGTSATATFSNFSLLTSATKVQRGTVTLSSNAEIDVSGTTPTDAGFLKKKYQAPWALAFNSDGTFNSTSSDTVTLNWTPVNSSGVSNGAAAQTLTVDLSNATQFGSPFAVQAMSQDGYTTGRLNQVDVDSSGVFFGRYSNGQSLALGQVALANFTNPQGLQPTGDTTWGETFASGTAAVSAPGTASLGSIQSGARESSNAELTEGLVNMITTQRNFQANTKVIETVDNVTQSLINLR